jgi:hypothetical protein
MTCPSCERAENDPRCDEFTAGCVSCKARALAATGAHLESAEAKQMTLHYASVLKSMFGDGWKEGNTLVKAWAAKMDQLKRAVT